MKGNNVTVKETTFEDSAQYKTLSDEAQFVYRQIVKYHAYFKRKDKHYNLVIKVIKLSILILAMINTIILGLNGFVNISYQIVIGLVASSLITFLSAVAAYFNFEEYWMRNIAIHIELNIMRDNFIFDANAAQMTPQKATEYQNRLTEIQKENVKYWKKVINKI